MYEDKINTNKISCDPEVTSGGNYENNNASTILKIKISGKKISASVKIINNNDFPIFIFKEDFKNKDELYEIKHPVSLTPPFIIFRQHEQIHYLGPKMSGLRYRPEDFQQIAPRATVTIQYNDLEKQYDFSDRTTSYTIVHRHLEYDPVKASLSLLNASPVNFVYSPK